MISVILYFVHAANNSWGNWKEFNRMIGLGGWGGRNEKSGPYVYYGADGKVVRDTSAGKCGTQGPQNEFVVTLRDKTHPITKDLPDFWMHTKDECYSLLRGPAENMTIRATEADTPELKTAGRNRPPLSPFPVPPMTPPAKSKFLSERLILIRVGRTCRNSREISCRYSGQTDKYPAWPDPTFCRLSTVAARRQSFAAWPSWPAGGEPSSSLPLQPPRNINMFTMRPGVWWRWPVNGVIFFPMENPFLTHLSEHPYRRTGS